MLMFNRAISIEQIELCQNKDAFIPIGYTQWAKQIS